MALHRAEQILASVLTTVTSLTTTGANAKRNYLHPFDAAVTSGIYVIMGSDIPVDLSDRNLAYIDYNLEVILSVHVKNSTPETQINLIKKEITIALMADYTQGLAFVLDTMELGWEQPELVDAEKPTAVVQGRFEIKYRRSLTDPSA